MLIPSTFEERGVAAPFTTPVLSQARVRKDYRGRLEVVVFNLTDGKGMFVIPWPALTDVVTMTVADRMLHEQIIKDGATNPHTMRLAAGTVARTGLAGPELATAADKVEKEEREQQLLINCLLILRILEQGGQSSEKLVKALGTEEGRKVAKQELNRVSEQIGLPADEIDHKLEELAKLLVPIGTENSPMPARLRSLLTKLTAMVLSLRSWAQHDESDAAPLANFIADTADLTVQIAARCIADIDRSLNNVSHIMMNFEGTLREMERGAERLSWLLDGWEHILNWWAQAGSGPKGDQVAALGGILRVLPLVPKDEAEKAGAAGRQEAPENVLRGGSRRWVRAFQDWRTGTLDYDLVHRIEERQAEKL